jgi:hypothetical protein
MSQEMRPLKIGDRVRLIQLPQHLPNNNDLPTQSIFEHCLGQEFSVAGFNEIGWAELVIESLTGSVGETIWVEPEYLEPVSA